MKTPSENIEILKPKNQLRLFGYDNYFHSFVRLFDNRKMPNSILLSGPKGIGKSTFVYHLINYFLSADEDKRYSIKDYLIDKESLAYKEINNNTHPNFFLIENNATEKEIKIEKIRNLLKFLNKSTYRRDLKIILIDNVENLNLNSSNALLKSIEEPSENTFFFLIHNSSHKVLDTITSRCTKFKFFFTYEQKKNIFYNLIQEYGNSIKIKKNDDIFNFETPGNVIKYHTYLKNENTETNDEKLSEIFQFIERYKNEKLFETLSIVSFFIEKFYYDLCLTNTKNLNTHLLNYTKILNQLNDIKRFNLDEKNIFIWIKDILINEKK